MKYITLVLDKTEKEILTIITDGDSCERSNRLFIQNLYDLPDNDLSYKRFYFCYPKKERNLTIIPKKYNKFKENPNYIFIKKT